MTVQTTGSIALSLQLARNGIGCLQIFLVAGEIPVD
jgi:hypothetical protein